jgi:uncharacterized protein YkwD
MNNPQHDALFERAYDLSRQHQDRAAQAILEGILAENPNYVEALVLMGYLVPRSGEARGYFERALQLDPYHVQAQQGLLKLERASQRRWTGLLVLGMPLALILVAASVFLGINFFDSTEGEATPTSISIIASETPTVTLTSTLTATTTPSPSPSLTVTLTISHTSSPTIYLSSTERIVLRATPTQFIPSTRIAEAPSPSPTPTITLSLTETPSPTLTPTLTETTTATPTITETATTTSTSTITETATITPTATETLTATATETLTATATGTSTHTATETETQTPTTTATQTPTATETHTPTATETETPTATPTATDEPTSTRTPSPTPTDEPPYYIYNNSAEMAALINQLRCTQGLHPLTVNGLLNATGETHSIDMAMNNFFGHTGSDGSNVVTRAVAEGYPPVIALEAIAAGATGIGQVFNQWKGVPDYYANMLSADVFEMGLGHISRATSDFDHYWTLVLGSRGTGPLITCADLGL